MFEGFIIQIYTFFQWYIAARFINNDWRNIIEKAVSLSYSICAVGGRLETIKKIQIFNFIRDNCDDSEEIAFYAGTLVFDLPCITIKYIDKASQKQMETTFCWCDCCPEVGCMTEE